MHSHGESERIEEKDDLSVTKRRNNQHPKRALHKNNNHNNDDNNDPPTRRLSLLRAYLGNSRS